MLEKVTFSLCYNSRKILRFCILEIVQFCVCANDVFLLTADGYLRKVTLFPLEKAIEKLQFRERFNAAAQVVCAIYDADKT